MTDQTLSEELKAAAADFAQSGLRARLEGNSMVYLLHVATALELLSKAFLASLAGSLVAANDFDSLLHGSGHSTHARKPRSRMRTITMREALERVGQVVPAIQNLKGSLQLLTDVRNGVVHAGQVDQGSVDAVLVPFLRACDHLLAEMPAGDRQSMWGDLEEMVDARLSESLKAAELEVADDLASARLAFESRYGSMESSVRDAVLAGIEDSYNPEKYEEDLVECPACERQAMTRGSYDVEWEADWDYADGESYIAGAFPVVTYSPGLLECRVCGLELDGEEKLQAAGLSTSWQFEDVNPADFYEPPENDW
jgi:flagellar hook-basal body complex protein FliE